MEGVNQTVKINPEVWKELKIQCAKKDINISDCVEELIKKYLNKNNEK